jgi:hypothetical protein
MLEQDLLELMSFLNEQKGKLIAELGGMEHWVTLSAAEQSMHEATLMDQLKGEIGKQVYETLPAEARSALDLFVWAGCCMHKDQNSFKGGATAMGAFWEANGHKEPIFLANKANTAKV